MGGSQAESRVFWYARKSSIEGLECQICQAGPDKTKVPTFSHIEAKLLEQENIEEGEPINRSSMVRGDVMSSSECGEKSKVKPEECRGEYQAKPTLHGGGVEALLLKHGDGDGVRTA